MIAFALFGFRLAIRTDYGIDKLQKLDEGFTVVALLIMFAYIISAWIASPQARVEYLKMKRDKLLREERELSETMAESVREEIN